MLKKYFLFLCYLLLSTTLWGQSAPRWLNKQSREFNYPNDIYLTGFVMGAIRPKETQADATARIKREAQADLSERIRVKVGKEVVSKNRSTRVDNSEQISEIFEATITTETNAEITGMKVDSYYDKEDDVLYGFAYASKVEVKEYYTENISFIVQKIETTMSNAKAFESSGNKGKAKKVYEEIKPLFAELDFAQSLLIAIGSNSESLQTAKSLALKSEFATSVSRLQSAIVVHINATEKNFEQTVHLLEPKLKAELSKRGCSFTPDAQKADWLLSIEASTRKGSNADGIYFSYLDAGISLVEQRTGKEIYSNNFTDLKGAGLDYEKAGRKAYDSSFQQITKEIINSIEK